MRNRYKQVLAAFFRHQIFQTRVEVLDINQDEMAHRIGISTRCYVDLENGKTTCSAVTLALFLAFVCNDPIAFREELRYAFESVRAKAT